MSIRYRRDEELIAEAIKSTRRGVRDVQRPTGTERARTVEAVETVVSETLPALQQELDAAAASLAVATEDAAAALGAATAANTRIDDEVLPAIDDAAASPVTDARLTAGSLTVWPFQNSTIPAGALEPGAVGGTDIADFAVTAKKLSTTRLHIIY
ncbi:MAG: hypothetical protein KKF42_04410 [Actinobacteria bacterium]|nr:hypothetical protein [Actinomycetota bacterium]